LLSAAVLAGCAGSHHTTTRATLAINGGSALERKIMRQVIERLAPRTIGSVTIRESLHPAAIDLSMTHLPWRTSRVRPLWEDWIVAAAFARRLVHGKPRPTVTLAESDFADRIWPRPEQNPDPKPLSPARAASVADDFRRTSLQTGARVLEARVGRPYGLAPSVTLSVRDPARFLRYKLGALLDSLNRGRNRYEGSYLGIVDSNGRVVLETGGSTRVQAGSYWVRRDLDNCSPIVHLGSPSRAQPPRCPV
jgi:hypothetical protein